MKIKLNLNKNWVNSELILYKNWVNFELVFN